MTRPANFRQLSDNYWKLEADRIRLERQIELPANTAKIPALAEELALVRRQQDDLALAIQAKRGSPSDIQWAEIEEKLSDCMKVCEALNNRLAELEGFQAPEIEPLDPSQYEVTEVSPQDDSSAPENGDS